MWPDEEIPAEETTSKSRDIAADTTRPHAGVPSSIRRLESRTLSSLNLYVNSRVFVGPQRSA